MQLFAARYFYDMSEKDYEVVVYESRAIADECPHDYLFSFTKKQWRQMGCRVPKKHETLAIKLCATPKD